MTSRWKKHPVWNQWGRLTAYHNALEVACDWYSAVWKLVPIDGIDATTVVRRREPSVFRKSTGEFKTLLDDRRPLANMLYLASFALFEGFCSDAFSALVAAGKTNQLEDHLVGGIEHWAAKLLALTGRDWTKYKYGQSGLLEAGLVRNALAHGSKTFGADEVERFTQIGIVPPWAAGHAVPSDPIELLKLRHRLNYFLTIVQQGLDKTVP